MENKYLSVNALSKYIKYKFDNDRHLKNVYLKGEISNFKRHSRGHLYLTLKDNESSISCIMFLRDANNLDFDVKNGHKVKVVGNVSVFLASGVYQIYIKSMELDGLGELYIKYEKLKKELNSEGLFSVDNKKIISKYPKAIGVCTSETGAALQDILNTIKRRYPITKIYIYPTLVQGEKSKESIIKSIKMANSMNIVDTIILGRGGGSIEDLWSFNEKDVAYAIFNSKIPIISAVGHEIDFTISDYVSDLRAATPTAAAELSVPDKKQLINNINSLKEKMELIISNDFNAIKKKMERINNSFVFKNPNRIFEKYEYKLDHLSLKMSDLVNKKLIQEKNRFNVLINKLELLNPLNIMIKGYSILKKEEKIVKSINDISINENIDAIMSDGEVSLKVLKIKEINHE